MHILPQEQDRNKIKELPPKIDKIKIRFIQLLY